MLFYPLTEISIWNIWHQYWTRGYKGRDLQPNNNIRNSWKYFLLKNISPLDSVASSATYSDFTRSKQIIGLKMCLLFVNSVHFLRNDINFSVFFPVLHKNRTVPQFPNFMTVFLHKCVFIFTKIRILLPVGLYLPMSVRSM